MAWQISRAAPHLFKRPALSPLPLPLPIARSSHAHAHPHGLTSPSSPSKQPFYHLFSSAKNLSARLAFPDSDTLATGVSEALATGVSETLEFNRFHSLDDLSLAQEKLLPSAKLCAEPWILADGCNHACASNHQTLNLERPYRPWIFGSLANRHHACASYQVTITPTIANMLHLCRPFSSASKSSSHHLERIQELQEEEEEEERVVSDILHTQDGKVLYSGMKSTELLSTLLNLHLVAYEPLVDLSIRVLKSPVMSYAAFRRPLLAMVKKTAYSHFCAGEDVAEASVTLQRTWELGLKSILDYSLEDAMDNSSCDDNLQGFLQTIHQTLQLPLGSVSFSCVKITALCPLPLLERISSLLRWQHRHADIKLPWREEVLPLLADVSPTYHVQSPPEPLTDVEERDLQMAKERLWKLCRACDEASLPLLVDAEYTSVQPAIDYFTYTAALQFNQNGQPLVYGTVQAYLRDALPRLSLAANQAAKRGVGFGVKLVRGAYITRESAFAASMGAESPIHSCIEDTHNCYDTCAAFMMERAASGQGAVVLATHNFDSGRAAAVKAENLGLLKGNPRLQFGQLKGMADGLSLALVHAGFQVSKYLPFGPVGHVIPYLIRRAEENRGLLGNTLADRIRIRQELKRRLFSYLQV